MVQLCLLYVIPHNLQRMFQSECIKLSRVVKLYVNVYIRPILQYTLQNKISYPVTHLIIESDIEYISDKTAICN